MITQMTTDEEFKKLLGYCSELAQMFDQGLVYIGGIAVYLHAINAGPTTQDLAETTHDADFYISFADMGDLRDIEEVVPNRRLSKSQMIKGGFEFDIYTERQSDLIVPYAEVMAHSAVKSEIRVASLEHLFALKLEAWRDRRNSAKGDKDARDLVRLACVANAPGNKFEPDLVAPYLNDQHVELLNALRKTPEVVGLARGNSVTAKKMRRQLEQVISSIEKSLGSDDVEPPPTPRMK